VRFLLVNALVIDLEAGSAQYAFEFQQGNLAIQATGIAGERSVRAEDAVAWDHHRDRVVADGSADSARRHTPVPQIG
jgi:hypothetical protein